ncbi:MAG: carbohydrate ABC transporter permease [Bifidobacterium tibiigranuli]|jgi:multiple sugar transport system permease protein|nr:carbohydrate ABC transporter permease [Bifidobacterium tibiigranuli]
MLLHEKMSRATRLILVIVLIVLAGFPIYWMFSTAITPTELLYSGKQPVIPDFSRSLKAFQVLVDDSGAPFLHWMGNSLIVAIGATLLSLFMALLAAYGLSRYRFRGKGIVSVFFFATQMLPEALLVVPLYSLFVTLGLLNKLYGLILVDTAFSMPVAVFLLKAAIDQIPYELEEAAKVDGCGALTILHLLILPLVAPSLASAAVITFFDGWNEYLFATTFIQESNNWVASTGLASFIGEFTTPLDLVFSAALVFTIPAAVFFLILQRRIVSGLTAGSVKG